jgi:hypothetical protein
MKVHLTNRCSQPLAGAMTSSQHVYEVKLCKDRRGFDLISDEDAGLPRSPLANKGQCVNVGNFH